MHTAPLDACQLRHPITIHLQTHTPELVRTDDAAAAVCGSEMCETTSDTRALVRVCVVDRAGRTVLQVRLAPFLRSHHVKCTQSCRGCCTTTIQQSSLYET